MQISNECHDWKALKNNLVKSGKSGINAVKSVCRTNRSLFRGTILTHQLVYFYLYKTNNVPKGCSFYIEVGCFFYPLHICVYKFTSL